MSQRVLGATAALVVVIAVLTYFGTRNDEDPLAYQRQAEIHIVVGDERVGTVELDTIPDVQEHHFTVDRSDREDTNTYGGVLLKELLEAVDVDMTDAEQVVAKAADGYTVALAASEVLDDDGVFVVYKINDEPLSPKEEGGSGPYRIVARGDEFGQRWLKYLYEITVR